MKRFCCLIILAGMLIAGVYGCTRSATSSSRPRLLPPPADRRDCAAVFFSQAL